MANKATDLIDALGEEGKMAGLTVKVTPEIKVCMSDLRKKTGLGISAIVQNALDLFFDGYVVTTAPDAEDEE